MSTSGMEMSEQWDEAGDTGGEEEDSLLQDSDSGWQEEGSRIL